MLLEPQGDGEPLKTHLEAIERMTGKTPEELILPELPDHMTRIWEWFGELSQTRQSGLGTNPISYCEIAEWARLTGREPSFLEVETIKALDHLYMSKGRKDGNRKRSSGTNSRG